MTGIIVDAIQYARFAWCVRPLWHPRFSGQLLSAATLSLPLVGGHSLTRRPMLLAPPPSPGRIQLSKATSDMLGEGQSDFWESTGGIEVKVVMLCGKMPPKGCESN
jgi:hypothetical protein